VQPPPPPAGLRSPPPAAAPGPAPAVTGAAGSGSLFDLDAPRAEPLAPSRESSGQAAPASEPREPIDAKHSTTEFLYQLDAPARATSREGELEPELTPARHRASAPADEPRHDPSANSAGVAPRTPVLPLELGVLLPPSEPPRTREAQHEQRLNRAILRIQTCRDALRLLGLAGLSEDERKGAARMLMDLDAALGAREGRPSAIKDPDTVLAQASDAQLDAVDRLIGPIEDRLLLLDQTISREAFEEVIATRSASRKLIVRYGRLLGSRRFQADERRSRFEAIATELLTTTDDDGFYHLLPIEKVRAVLQRLIGGLPHKISQQELQEALDYLRGSIERLSGLTSAEEFFESGFYLDVQGYKLTMRDQLLAPEFLYFSVVLNAMVRNSVERWIRGLERLNSSKQVLQESSPREQITAALRAQEEAVENALGVKRRPTTLVSRAEPARSQREEKTATAKFKARLRDRLPRLELTWDRNLLAVVLSSLVTLGAVGFLLMHTGVVGQRPVHAMSGEELHRISPLLARGWIVGEGDGRQLTATVFGKEWRPLDGRRRREEAERIAEVLTTQGIMKAEIKLGSTVAISITQGYVDEVAGGKL
jgi:hypothetical protein